MECFSGGLIAVHMWHSSPLHTFHVQHCEKNGKLHNSVIQYEISLSFLIFFSAVMLCGGATVRAPTNNSSIQIQPKAPYLPTDTQLTTHSDHISNSLCHKNLSELLSQQSPFSKSQRCSTKQRKGMGRLKDERVH